MSEWQLKPLDEVVEHFIDYRGKTPNKTDSGIPLITAKIVKNGGLLTPFEFIAEDDYLEWMTRGFPEINDVVLTTEAPLGEVALIKDKHVALAQRIITLRGYPDQLHNVFLKYWLQSEYGQYELDSRASGTTVFGIKASVLKKMPVPVPPLPEQKAIADALSALDDKINLLQRQNETLEKMAETLFRQWFIEEAKEDWEEVTVGDIFVIKGGSTPSTKNHEFWDGEIYWTSPRDLSGNRDVYLHSTSRKITQKGLEKISSGLLPINTLLMSSRAPIGYLAIANIEVAINQGYIAIMEHELFKSEFMYLWCKTNMDVIKNSGNGSVFQEISKASFNKLAFVIPDLETLNKFNQVSIEIFGKQKNNEVQIQTLQNLRDTLLPKLMSGEVRVNLD